MMMHKLKVSGLLSFGLQGIDLSMEPLNVLIGPNGAGKSNLLGRTFRGRTSGNSSRRCRNSLTASWTSTVR